ncbi:MAG: protease Do [Parcubacteria group bacterium GW2011_GWA2_49_16]|nr:MAG: protease Do [Parcubacteria group bacterium GW2011_GWA2_49_16]
MAIIQINRPNIPKLNVANLKNRRFAKRIVLILVCGLVGFGGGLLGAQVNKGGNLAQTTTAQKQQYVSSEGQLIAQIAKDVGQSVVSIEAQSQTSVQDIFGFSFPQQQTGAGTGFIVSDSGIVVTNRHVVPAGTTDMSVTLSDGTKFTDVKVIGRTSQSSSLDVAFLKINDLKGKKLTPVTLGDSSKMQVGDRVIAIGNALGQFQNTVTSGIISGYGRDVTATDQTGLGTETLSDLFQTDAAINPGNSGGPLVNISGEVIGINTAVAGGAQNIGFAIPVNDIKGLIEGVLADGELKQPYLGVRYLSLTDDIAYQYNLSVNRGAYIAPSNQTSVLPDSPADKAGLKEKDIITKVNNIAIDDKTNLSSALSRFRVGDSVKLTVIRAGKTMTLNAILEVAPNQ